MPNSVAEIVNGRGGACPAGAANTIAEKPENGAGDATVIRIGALGLNGCGFLQGQTPRRVQRSFTASRPGLISRHKRTERRPRE
jgi:hypothetical protein